MNKEIENASMSRERFIDFLKVVGLLMVIFNTTYLIRFNDSFGEYLIYNLSGHNLEGQYVERQNLEKQNVE